MLYRILLSTVFICLAVANVAQAERLPRNVIPKAYTITLHPDIASLKFNGEETIEIEVQQSTSTIVMNALEMTITSASLAMGKETVPGTVRHDPSRQTVTIAFPIPLPAGRARLHLTFTGIINQPNLGLSYNRYVDGDGKAKTLLTTHMEPTDARRMFPCWDEPDLRATFQLAITIPDNFTAVSNMPVSQTTRENAGQKRVTFIRTPRMSTYLVALVAGELESTGETIDGVQVNIVTTRGKSSMGRYALDCMRRLLPYYRQYFGVKYPLPKLDLIAIPIRSGAMENWGAVIYGENALLFDSKTSSLHTRQGIFYIVAHETAHMWFGDLVTTKWWDDIWLNEGFATWMAAKATAHFNPSWDWPLYQQTIKNLTMDIDGMDTTHPIQNRVVDEANAIAQFDAISYYKGAAIIRMIEAYVTPRIFRDGIREYIRKHEYANTTTADLWKALQDVSKQPISSVAKAWTEQPGYPVVSADIACTSGQRNVSLRQTRFDLMGSSTQQRWPIPLTLRDLGKTAIQSLLLSTPSYRTRLGNCESLLVFNPGSTGFYRVQYDQATFMRFIHTVQRLTAADRLTLLSDSWAFARAGRAPLSNALDLLLALRAERNDMIVSFMIDQLDNIHQLSRDDKPLREKLERFERAFLQPILHRVGWNPQKGEAPPTTRLRAQLIETLGSVGDDDVVTACRSRFEAWLKDPASLTPDLRDAVVTVTGRQANRATFDRLHELGRQTQSVELKQSLYNGMSHARDEVLAAQALDATVTQELSPFAAMNMVVTVAYADHAGLAWTFFKAHHQVLRGRIGPHNQDQFTRVLASTLQTDADAADVQQWSNATLPAAAQLEIRKAVAIIHFRALMKRRLLNALDSWLKMHAGQNQSPFASVNCRSRSSSTK